MYEAIDCQGFAGGYTLGVVQAGFKLVGKREMTGGFGAPNCEANRHLLGYDWDLEAVDPVAWTAKHVEYVFGNPPCSGFSLFTGDQRNRGIHAKVNHCMWAFAEYAARCTPYIAAYESVQQAFKEGRELMQALRARVEELTGLRYDLYHVYHNAYELGGVARRPRYFWVISRIPFGVEYPELRYLPTIEDAWKDLDGLSFTWQQQPYRRPALSPWAKQARNGNVAVDGHVGESNLNSRRLASVLEAMREFGGWQPRTGMWPTLKYYYDQTGTLPEGVIDKLPKLIERDWQMGFTQPYRWSPNEPARVIVGGALNLVIHPWQDRLITHREAARVMGFPDDWRIVNLRNKPGLCTTWGKGISVQCGRWIAEQVRHALDGEPGENSGEPIGEREYLIKHHAPIKVGRVGARWEPMPARVA